MFNPQGHGIMYLPDNLNVKVIGRELLNGDDYVVLEVTSPVLGSTYNKTKLWVDMNKGFTVPKSEVFSLSKSTGEVTARQVYITELKQYGDNLWGPAKYTMTQYGADGTKKMQVAVTYQPDFKINIPGITVDTDLNLPFGTKVYDEVLATEYTVP